MKIIKKGRKWSKKFKCMECNAALMVEEEDLKVKNTAMSYAGETWEPVVMFVCPVCHSDNNCQDDIPAGIQDKLIEEAEEKYFNE